LNSARIAGAEKVEVAMGCAKTSDMNEAFELSINCFSVTRNRLSPVGLVDVAVGLQKRMKE
jgi:hypothetical protein